MKKQITLEQLYKIIEQSNEQIYMKNNMVFFGIDYHVANGIVFNSNEPVLKIPADKIEEVYQKFLSKKLFMEKSKQAQKVLTTRTNVK